MVEWELKYTKKSKNDSQLLKSCHLDGKAKNILNKIKEDPYGKPPPFEKLKADLCGKYSRRINIKGAVLEVIKTSKRAAPFL